MAVSRGRHGQDANRVDRSIFIQARIGPLVVPIQRHAIAKMIPKGAFKEIDGGGKKSKGAKSSKRQAGEPTAKMAETPSPDATDDATFDQSSGQDDATFEKDKSG